MGFKFFYLLSMYSILCPYGTNTGQHPAWSFLLGWTTTQSANEPNVSCVRAITLTKCVRKLTTTASGRWSVIMSPIWQNSQALFLNCWRYTFTATPAISQYQPSLLRFNLRWLYEAHMHPSYQSLYVSHMKTLCSSLYLQFSVTYNWTLAKPHQPVGSSCLYIAINLVELSLKMGQTR